MPGGDHRLVAQRDQVGQADVGHRGEVNHGRGTGPALRQQRHRAAFGRQAGDGADRHAVGEVGEAKVVRAEQHHAESGRVAGELGLGGPAGLPGLGVAGRQHARVADPGGRGVVQGLEQASLGHHQVGHVDLLADLRARGHGGLAVRLRTPPADQVGTFGEAELDQVVVRDLGERRFVRRAHQRDAARPEEAGQPFAGDLERHDCILDGKRSVIDPGGGALSTTHVTPGRPRDPAVDRRIAQAALDLFADAGWAGFAMEAVARRAGVGKASLYLRWNSKEALLTDAVTWRLARVADVDTGTLRGDLVGLLADLESPIASRVTGLPSAQTHRKRSGG